MIEPVLKAFEGLLSDFSWRRITALVILTLYVGLLFAVGEAITGHFRLARIQRAANILSRLQEIEARQFSPSSDLPAVHSDLVRKLRAINSPDATVLPGFAGFWKFLAAATPFFLMTLIFVPGIRKRQPGVWTSFMGIAFIAVLAGLTGPLIPMFLWPWGNLVVYPAGLFLVFGIFAVRWQKRKEKRVAAMIQPV